MMLQRNLTLKHELSRIIAEAVTAYLEDLQLEIPSPEIDIDVPRNPEHGDFSTNVAMLLAKPVGRSPREIATAIVARLGDARLIETVEVAGPGFINVRVAPSALFDVVKKISAAGADYGRCDAGGGEKVQVEFVSANPTGPLHVGHGRGAAYGSVLANLLRALNFEVACEYYVNDAGRQIDILAVSVWLRYLEHCGGDMSFPDNAYRGAYIGDIATALRLRDGDRYLAADPASVLAAGSQSDPELALDQLIAACKHQLAENYAALQEFACTAILDEIKDDLERFGARFDVWYSERSLVARGLVEAALDSLRDNDAIYERDGAQWFRSSAYGDEKDRVVVRENGATTYFASDIAYHADKVARGFHKLIDIWGADHHGYVARVKNAVRALGVEPGVVEILLVQFAALYRGGEKVPMSTRAGEFVTLRELMDEVGVDAARFFYITRRCDQHLDFDLDLAKSQSNDNPVYYIQYAHARICSLYTQLSQQGLEFEMSAGIACVDTLTAEPEVKLANLLGRYPDVILLAATNREPHLLANFLKDLAAEFHAYYNGHRIIVDDERLRNARLALVTAVRQVIRNGLDILGVAAPTTM